MTYLSICDFFVYHLQMLKVEGLHLELKLLRLRTRYEPGPWGVSITQTPAIQPDTLTS